MPKRTPDIVFEDAVPHTKHVRQNYGFGSCGWDSGWDVPTDADLMDEELMLQAREERRRMEMERLPNAKEAEIFDIVLAFDGKERKFREGVIIDITTEFGEVMYCIEPFDSEDAFTTGVIKNGEDGNFYAPNVGDIRETADLPDFPDTED